MLASIIWSCSESAGCGAGCGATENARLCRIVTFFEGVSLQKSLQFSQLFRRRSFAVFLQPFGFHPKGRSNAEVGQLCSSLLHKLPRGHKRPGEAVLT